MPSIEERIAARLHAALGQLERADISAPFAERGGWPLVVPTNQ
jgi:hypothetical protein